MAGRYPEGVAAEDIDFEALAHVLANTCLWGGRTTRYHSLAARAVIVSEEVEAALDGIVPEERRSLALHALLADAPAAWFGGLDPASKKAAERDVEADERRSAGRCGRRRASPRRWTKAMRNWCASWRAWPRRPSAGTWGMPASRRRRAMAFPPLRRRIKPVDPDKAAKLWLERFRAAFRPGGGSRVRDRDGGQAMSEVRTILSAVLLAAGVSAAVSAGFARYAQDPAPGIASVRLADLAADHVLQAMDAAGSTAGTGALEDPAPAYDAERTGCGRHRSKGRWRWLRTGTG